MEGRDLGQERTHSFLAWIETKGRIDFIIKTFSPILHAILQNLDEENWGLHFGAARLNLRGRLGLGGGIRSAVHQSTLPCVQFTVNTLQYFRNSKMSPSKNVFLNKNIKRIFTLKH